MKISELTEDKVLDEAGLGRVLQNVKTRNIGMISACRADEPNLEIRKTKNLANTEQLKKDITAAGFGYQPLMGSYIENAGTPNQTKVIEYSFLIVESEKSKDILYRFLKQEAAKFNQESFSL